MTTREIDWARMRVEKKYKLRVDAISYILVNLFLVGVWAVAGFGYWPGWVIAGWSVMFLLAMIAAYTHRPLTTQDIERVLRAR